MNGFTKRAVSALLGCAALGTSGMASAEEAESESAFTISGSAGLFSQYRFRGVSLSDEKFAAQASIGVSHDSGFYVGAWGSNLAGFGTFGGSNVELDLYGGWKGGVGGVDLDIGVVDYQYPGTANTDFLELYASASKALGPVTGKVGVYYSPDQKHIADDNFYLYSDWSAAIPNTPFTLKAHAGYTDGVFALGESNLFDYSVGVDYVYKALTFNVSYVDTDYSRAGALAAPLRDIADSSVLFSVTAAF